MKKVISPNKVQESLVNLFGNEAPAINDISTTLAKEILQVISNNFKSLREIKNNLKDIIIVRNYLKTIY